MNYCRLDLPVMFLLFPVLCLYWERNGGGGGPEWQKEDDWTLVDVGIRYGHFRAYIWLSI